MARSEDLTDYQRAAELIDSADSVFIGAGAGMSAAANLDYTDESSFAERFPAMVRYGFRCQYHLMGYPFEDEALKWGYYAAAMNYVYTASQTPVYQDLLSLVANKNYFVMTSNVDRYFHKNGFNESRVYTPQGDYEKLQCLQPCRQIVWDAFESIYRMLLSLNPDTQMVEDRSALPVCPNCDGPVFMNVRGGNWFVDSPYRQLSRALNQWLEEAVNQRLVLIEIGSGFNTPGVIRQPMESIESQFEQSHLIRINRDHPRGPEGTISIQQDADVALRGICNVIS